jgi:hypothetical protein
VVIAEELQTQLKAERRDIDVVVLGDANAVALGGMTRR